MAPTRSSVEPIRRRPRIVRPAAGTFRKWLIAPSRASTPSRAVLAMTRRPKSVETQVVDRADLGDCPEQAGHAPPWRSRPWPAARIGWPAGPSSRPLVRRAGSRPGRAGRPATGRPPPRGGPGPGRRGTTSPPAAAWLSRTSATIAPAAPSADQHQGRPRRGRPRGRPRPIADARRRPSARSGRRCPARTRCRRRVPGSTPASPSWNDDDQSGPDRARSTRQPAGPVGRRPGACGRRGRRRRPARAARPGRGRAASGRRSRRSMDRPTWSS